ncbi:MAG: type III toxin-antitoxin system ToxN/AbiQ family toxin [Clostridium sp.]
MKWYSINSSFLSQLRLFEKRIPNDNYGVDKYKPFFGALFEVGELVYVTQVSHPKPRHAHMKNSKDFLKIYNENRFLAVVNLNYMFPVHKDKLIEIEYGDIETFRTFKDNKDKSKYINLLKIEMKAIKAADVDIKAKNLYEFKYKFPEHCISKRCFDFKGLEDKCLEIIKL